MTRTRHTRPQLTESWDDVENEINFDEDDEDVVDSDSNERTSRHSRVTRTDFAYSRSANSRTQLKPPSNGPDLVMPSSPDGGAKARAKTPHFRLNERSLTSDAGALDAGRVKPRAQTQRFRLNERSLTSDAGQFKRKGSTVSIDDAIGEANEDDSSTSFNMLWDRFVQPLLKYSGDIVQLALQHAKPLLSYVLLAYVLGALLVFGSNFINHSIHNALSPICRIPGLTYFFSPSFCPTRDAPKVEGLAEFDKLVQVQSSFDEVLEASSVGATLPMDMKRSEASFRDLKHVVQYSSLPSKNELVFEFNGFIDTARQASQDLARFNSRIGRAVDHILSTNRWTLSVIDGVAATDASRGSISKFFSEHFNIFAPFYPVSLSQDMLLDQYLRHTSAVEDQILSLITEAQALLVILENLDGRLDVLAEISTRDGLRTQDARDEILAFLWTKLGGNRSSVKRYDKQLELLQQVGQYRRLAWAHVTSTMVKLQAIRSDLEDLRERVAMPETIGVDKIPLQVHIDSINLGIQRLEQQRDASRVIERENHARILGNAEAGDARLLGDREL